jgi:2-amino-4-hydroxy-6-hydroxymethyldihydropteridine diphosphokinase
MTKAEVLIGLGAILPAPGYATPRATRVAAVGALSAVLGPVVGQSRWFESEPVPKSDQPWFVNGVVRIRTEQSPEAVLAALHRIEADFGRVRRVRWEARLLDLDLLAADGIVQDGPPALPHPRLHQRRFVLLPLLDVAPHWRHPVLNQTVTEMLAALADSYVVRPLQGGAEAV